MPYGFLIGVSLMAGSVLLCLLPVRPGPTQRWSARFVLTVTVNEVPAFPAAWLVGSTLLQAIGGGLASPVAVAGVVVAAAGIGGAGVIARSGLAARGVLVRVVGDGVPAQHRWAKLAFAPLPLGPASVRRVADVAYGPDGVRQQLDVYVDEHRSGGPVLVYFHGGGYRWGGKHREARLLLLRLASQGWMCVSANYRLNPVAGYPEQIADAHAAIGWAVAHAPRFGADPGRVYLAGSSAGGHLALCAGLRSDCEGIIALYPYVGPSDADVGAGSSPFAHVGPSTPPCLVVHGDHDSLVRVEDVREFVRRLRAVSTQPVVYAELPGAEHGFDLFRSARFDAVVDAVLAFSGDVRRGGRGGDRARR